MPIIHEFNDAVPGIATLAEKPCVVTRPVRLPPPRNILLVPSELNLV